MIALSGVLAVLALAVSSAPANAAGAGVYCNASGTLCAPFLPGCQDFLFPAATGRFLGTSTLVLYGADTNGNGQCDENFITAIAPGSGLVVFSATGSRYQIV